MSTEVQVMPEPAPAAPQPEAGLTVREEFGATEVAMTAETASTAVAAMARARVEARYVVALRRPRDWDDVRSRFLKECKRPSFADVALYNKPIGRGIEGPSIRMAEAAIRCMGNIDVENYVAYDDETRRKVVVSVTDLEANVTYPKEILLTKTVERSKPSDDGTFISVRKNTRGANVYLVPATEDDMLQKEAALVSKAIRTNGLRLMPGDILEEGIRTVKKTLADRAAKDPDAERNAIADAFASLSVMPSDLKGYLGHDLAQCSPAELVALRSLYNAIKQGEFGWADVVKGTKGETPEAAPASKAEILKEKIGTKK